MAIVVLVSLFISFLRTQYFGTSFFRSLRRASERATEWEIEGALGFCEALWKRVRAWIFTFDVFHAGVLRFSVAIKFPLFIGQTVSKEKFFLFACSSLVLITLNLLYSQTRLTCAVSCSNETDEKNSIQRWKFRNCIKIAQFFSIFFPLINIWCGTISACSEFWRIKNGQIVLTSCCCSRKSSWLMLHFLYT